MSTVRQGFSGEQLGNAYADPTKAGLIPKHTYRMTWIIGVQPARAGWLLGDSGGGTPQRMMWFPATDPRITADKAAQYNIAPLQIPALSEWRYPTELTVPDEAKTAIINGHAQRQSGAGEALDGHAMFAREKCAFALALLDGRTRMNSEDWELSGIAAEVSTHIRNAVAAELDKHLRRDAAEAGALRGVALEAADNERTVASVERVQRVLRLILAKLDAAGGQMKNRDLTHSIASRDKKGGALKDALTMGVRNGLIQAVDNGAEWRKL
jgi:hypothetical protein